MGKIIRLADKANVFLSLEDFLGEACEELIKHGTVSIVIAAKNAAGEVLTGYFRCDVGTRQEICGHIQCDIIDQMILANLDRYGGGE